MEPFIKEAVVYTSLFRIDFLRLKKVKLHNDNCAHHEIFSLEIIAKLKAPHLEELTAGSLTLI